MKAAIIAGCAALFLATGTAHAHDSLDNRDPDWIFECPERGNVYIYEGGRGRNLEPPCPVGLRHRKGTCANGGERKV
jgi:hypothetical protein